MNPTNLVYVWPTWLEAIASAHERARWTRKKHRVRRCLYAQCWHVEEVLA